MVTIDDLRRIAVTFPEVEESIHFRFRQPIFSVRGKPFAGGGGSKGELAAVFSISQEEAATAVSHDPAIYEEIWRPGAKRSFVGLRVDLAKVSKKRVQDLVDHAWGHKAPKNVVSAYEETRRAPERQAPNSCSAPGKITAAGAVSADCRRWRGRPLLGRRGPSCEG